MQSSQEQPNAKRQRKNDDLSDQPTQPMKIDDLIDFCLENIFDRLDLKSLKIGYYSYKYTGKTQMSSITELLDLIKNNSSMSKLSVNLVHGCATSTEIQRFVSEHPELVELDLNCKFMPAGAIALISQLGSLKRFKSTMQMKDYSGERSDFASKLDSLGWDYSDNYIDITITRRE